MYNYNYKTENYNLLYKDWIPVLYNNGNWKRVGIIQAFEDAGKIRQIAASNPMDRFAIFRFLLALVYWCRGNPPENPGEEIFTEEIPSFLSKEENRQYFNLLGEGKRFYQDYSAKRERPATDLIQEIPTGNNFWHFMHMTDGEGGLCPACCALGLLRLPLYSVSGLPDLKSGINGTPPIYIFNIGKSLSESLILNWKKVDNIGIPSWIQHQYNINTVLSVPVLNGMTMLSRKVWLCDLDIQNVDCINCGLKGAKLITKCEYQTAGTQENEKWQDPSVIYSYEKNKRNTIKAQDLSSGGKFKMDKPCYFLIERFMNMRMSEGNNWNSSVFIIGFATDKAKNIDVWERFINLKDIINLDDLKIQYVNNWREAGNVLGVRLGRPKEANKVMVTSIRPHIENIISSRIGELLSGGEEAWQNAAEEYRPMMTVIAKSLSPGFTTSAVERYNQIKNTIPNLKPEKEKTDNTTKENKGETKWDSQQNTLKI